MLFSRFSRLQQCKEKQVKYKFFKIILPFLLFPILGNCSTKGLVVENFVDLHPLPGLFTVCHGYGCLFNTNVGLNSEQWERIESVFSPTAIDPVTERGYIADAIALFESFTGPLTGTLHDRGQADAIVFDSGQMDCIDETVNTTTYLILLEEQGLLRWHRKKHPVRRGFFIDGRWPHNTAVIEEKKTGRQFAVDSWFHSNGHCPEIIPLETWLAGWCPTEIK